MISVPLQSNRMDFAKNLRSCINPDEHAMLKDNFSQSSFKDTLKMSVRSPFNDVSNGKYCVV